MYSIVHPDIVHVLNIHSETIVCNRRRVHFTFCLKSMTHSIGVTKKTYNLYVRVGKILNCK